MPAACAAELEIHADPFNGPLKTAARMRLFHSYNVTKTNIHPHTSEHCRIRVGTCFFYHTKNTCRLQEKFFGDRKDGIFHMENEKLTENV